MTMPVTPVVAGVAESDLGETPDRNWLENAAVATVRALDDAGLSTDDVDGVGFAGADDYMPSLVLAEYLGVDRPTHTDATEAGFDDEHIYQEIDKAPDERRIPMEQRLKEEAHRPFEAWRNYDDRVEY
jgi:hypothetical protein